MSREHGQAVLSFVFLVGGITVLIGVTLALLAASFINSGFGFLAANRALAVASSGASDALMQLVRDKDFSAVTPYAVSVDTISASITVTQGTPSVGQARITSTATVFNRTRALEVVVAVSQQTGEVEVLSWSAISS